MFMCDYIVIIDGSLCSSPAHHCGGAPADHEECQLTGGVGPLVHHTVSVPDQAADQEHVNQQCQS